MENKNKVVSRIFLGGTFNNSTWRDTLIDGLKTDHFNPVVEDWTEECQAVEMDEKSNKCNVHLYVITKEMKGVFSIAEVIDSCHNDKVTTLLHITREGFDKAQLKSLDAVAELAMLRGGLISNSADESGMEGLRNMLNGLV